MGARLDLLFRSEYSARAKWAKNKGLVHKPKGRQMESVWRYTISMAEKRAQTKRLGVRFSFRVATYLDELARLGIHGTTAPEVAKKLVENEVERLIREGFLSLPTQAAPTQRGRSRRE